MLFLTRHHGILSDRHSTMRVKSPTILMDKQFVTCYKDCKLFETFMLPVIRSEPLRLLNEIFLKEIYEYLHQSCKAVESILQRKTQTFPHPRLFAHATKFKRNRLSIPSSFFHYERILSLKMSVLMNILVVLKLK